MRSPAPRVSAARICALNAGLQFVWGAILAVSLQERAIALGGNAALADYARVAAAGALVATIVQLAAGVLSDRAVARGGSRAPFYATGVALALPALGWFYAARSFAELVAAFLALEVAMNVCAGPYQAIIPDRIPPARRGRASAWMSAYQSIGNACGLVLAGFAHDLALVAASLGIGLGGTYVVTQLGSRGGAIRSPERGARFDARTALRGSLGTLLVSRGLVNVGFFTLLGFLLFFVRDALGVRGPALETQTALVFLTFTLSAVVGAIASAAATDRYDKRAVVTVAVAVIALALAALASARSLPPAYAAAALAGAAWGAFVTADWAIASALLPPAGMATAMGVWNVATTLPQTIAPLLAGALVASIGPARAATGVRAVVVLALVEFALGGAAIWRLPRLPRVEQRDDAIGDGVRRTRPT